MKPKEMKKKEAMYQVRRSSAVITNVRLATYHCMMYVQAHGFDEYISEYLVSLNRTLPDRRDDWCKLPANVQVPPQNCRPHL